MDQFDIAALFERLDLALGRGRLYHDPSRLRANSFMLVSIEPNGICTFQHMWVNDIVVRFDPRKARIL